MIQPKLSIPPCLCRQYGQTLRATTRRLTSAALRQFYDEVYYRDAVGASRTSGHLLGLAERFGPWQDRRLLDVACGTGDWLVAVAQLGAMSAGVDLSQVAIDACKQTLPQAELRCSAGRTSAVYRSTSLILFPVWARLNISWIRSRRYAR